MDQHLSLGLRAGKRRPMSNDSSWVVWLLQAPLAAMTTKNWADIVSFTKPLVAVCFFVG